MLIPLPMRLRRCAIPGLVGTQKATTCRGCVCRVINVAGTPDGSVAAGFRRCLTIALMLMPLVGSVFAAEGKPSAGELAELLFVKKVQPVFVQKCGGCHGESAKQIKGGYDMRSRVALLAGGESEEVAVVPGKPDRSPLLAAVRWVDGLEMPPKENDRLTKDQIQWVRQWITAGAPWPNAARVKQLARQNWPESGTAGQPVKTSGGQSEQWTNRRYLDEHLWAYRPLRQPQVPSALAVDTDNAVDAFVNRRLAAAQLDAAPRADKGTLIRRATFDLTGGCNRLPARVAWRVVKSG